MKCARGASESSAEQRGRPSGTPAAYVGGRATGGVARRTTQYARRGTPSAARCRPSRPPPHDECRHPLPPPATPFRSLCRLPPPLHDIVLAAILLAARCPSRNLLLVARSPLCRPLLAAWHPLPQLFARSATPPPAPRLSQSKRMAIYQRNARSGETAGTKNREMHDCQSQLDASVFANLLRPGETPSAVFK